jgi:D-arabinose 1-dehydrogenase-like Zn-dependent alcohol dehydrogenase
MTTMQAACVPSSGDARLELTELALPFPAPGWVRVRVEACGVCHSDSITVQNIWPIEYPRVPGHEVAGTIDAIGDDVVGWNAGDRVGVGWHGGHCGYCDRCRRGDFITCRNLQVPGIAYDGGYSEYTVVKANALARIPAALKSEEAAPLMCAGVTTFNSLRNSGARPGDLVAILGVGGLGHLGVQYAAKMGFETVAIARGRDKEELALKLGAQHYLDSESVDVGEALKKLGGARVVLSTVTEAKAMEPVIAGLAANGELLIVGASPTPLSLNTMLMIGGRQSVKAWPSGTCADSEDAMNFSMLTGVRAMIETLPLARAQEGYDRMMSGNARFRVVLATGGTIPFSHD